MHSGMLSSDPGITPSQLRLILRHGSFLLRLAAMVISLLRVGLVLSLMSDPLCTTECTLMQLQQDLLEERRAAEQQGSLAESPRTHQHEVDRQNTPSHERLQNQAAAQHKSPAVHQHDVDLHKTPGHGRLQDQAPTAQHGSPAVLEHDMDQPKTRGPERLLDRAPAAPTSSAQPSSSLAGHTAELALHEPEALSAAAFVPAAELRDSRRELLHPLEDDHPPHQVSRWWCLSCCRGWVRLLLLKGSCSCCRLGL